MHQMELFMRYPHDVQNEVLQRLLAKAKTTEWGEQYGYANLQGPHDFAEQVPLNTYEDLFPWIQRSMEGESSVLWPGEIRWFAKSSGTTNDRSKTSSPKSSRPMAPAIIVPAPTVATRNRSNASSTPSRGRSASRSNARTRSRSPGAAARR
ncbi:MAG: hypothetical protein EBR29_02360, partial [Sphingobacteriia bacterium]|nr:hypothetical protein [Sphingobacteriia bacterium]